MSAGGELLLPSDARLGSGSSASEYDAPSSSTDFGAAQGRVWIVDPQALFRRGLALLLRQWNPPITVLDFPDIAAALGEFGPDPALILVDAEQAAQQHFSGLIRLMAEVPTAPAILLAGEIKWKPAAKAFDLGARGYVSKSVSESVLRHALGLVASGEVYLPGQVLTRWTERRREPLGRLAACGRKGAAAALTPRQCEVLARIALGFSNKEIGRSLGLLESTVKVHVKTILKKLAASNRTQAAMLALDMGLARRPGS